MHRRALIAALALCTVGWGFAAPARADTGETGLLEGSVTYLERIALPPDAVLDVELLDVSRADVAAVRLSAQRWRIDRVPFPFALSFDPALIAPRDTYSVQARLLEGDEVLFHTTSMVPVLTRGAPERAEVILERAMPDASAQQPPLTESNWEVSKIRGQSVAGANPPSVLFLSGSLVAINGGCNSFHGSVESAPGRIRFPENMAGTLMACPAPHDQVERDFLAALHSVVRYELDGAELALIDAQDETVLLLKRTK